MGTGKEGEGYWGHDSYHDPNILHLPFPYPWIKESQENPRDFFRKTLAEVCASNGVDPVSDVCGVMMETFQGWGALFYPKEFVQEVEIYVKEAGALLAFDEMQAGQLAFHQMLVVHLLLLHKSPPPERIP